MKTRAAPKRNIIYIKSYSQRYSQHPKAKAIAKCFKCQARCLLLSVLVFWLEERRGKGENFQLRFVPKCERSNFCCALRRVCPTVCMSSSICICSCICICICICVSVCTYSNCSTWVVPLVTIRITKKKKTTQSRRILHAPNKTKQNENSKKIANFLFLWGRAKKNLRLEALSMNETRVLITHFFCCQFGEVSSMQKFPPKKYKKKVENLVEAKINTKT